jgi:hypothetical protein
MSKTYKLLSPDGSTYASPTPGTLGGNRKARIYGLLTCTAALGKGYAQHRVFFADEAAAIAAGYRPCGRCLRERYKLWDAGGVAGSSSYPWRLAPQK